MISLLNVLRCSLWSTIWSILGMCQTRLKWLSSSSSSMLGSQGFLGGSVITNLLTNAKMPESWVQSLGQEDLEEAMATHSRVLVWIILMTEEVGRLQSMGSQRVRHDWMTEHAHTCCGYKHLQMLCLLTRWTFLSCNALPCLLLQSLLSSIFCLSIVTQLSFGFLLHVITFSTTTPSVCIFFYVWSVSPISHI